MGGGKPLVPTAFETRTGPYAVFTSTKLDAEAPVVRQLQQLETRVADTLGIRVDPEREPRRGLHPRRPARPSSTSSSSTIPTCPLASGILPRPGEQAGRLYLLRRPARRGHPPRGDPRPAPRRHRRHPALARRGAGRVFRELPTGPTGPTPSTSAGSPPTSPRAGRPNLARLEGLKAVRQMSPARLPRVLGLGPLPAQRLQGQQGRPDYGYLDDLRAKPEPRAPLAKARRPRPPRRCSPTSSG